MKRESYTDRATKKDHALAFAVGSVVSLCFGFPFVLGMLNKTHYEIGR